MISFAVDSCLIHYSVLFFFTMKIQQRLRRARQGFDEEEEDEEEEVLCRTIAFISYLLLCAKPTVDKVRILLLLSTKSH